MDIDYDNHEEHKRIHLAFVESERGRGMTFPQAAYEIVVELYNRNVALAQGSDDHRRELTKMMAETMAYRLDRRWGVKRTASGHPQSKDSLCFSLGGGAFDAYDWQNGSTRRVQINTGSSPTWPNVSNQVFIPVDPKDWLGGLNIPNKPIEEPIEEPIKPPVPAPPYGEIMGMLKLLYFAVTELTTQVEENNRRIDRLVMGQTTFPVYRGVITIFGREYTLLVTPVPK